MRVREFDGEWGGRWRYDPSTRLGDGGFASVHPGESLEGAPVAVKIVDPQNFPDGFPARLLQREREIAEKLRDQPSDFLLQAFDVAQDGDRLLLVLPRAERSLSQHLRSPVDEHEVIEILQQLAAGLRELHQAPVFHRDLKPANVLLHAGKWKLADFGIARDAAVGTATATFRGAGTWPYMAPEIWEGRSPTVKTDLYALGCVAHEMLAGAPPFRGPGFEDYERQHRQEPPPRPEHLSNRALGELVLRLLEKEPASRPQDARAVEERLRKMALPLSPVQERLGRAVAQRVAERSEAEARRAQDRALREQRGAREEQALADLKEILDDARREIERVVPESQSSVDPRSSAFLLRADEVALQIVPWRGLVARLPDDELVLACAVAPTGPRIRGEFLIANAVCELVDGRLGWRLYRFQRSGLAVPARYQADYAAPWDREHGLQRRFFEDEHERRWILATGGQHAWTLRKVELTGETLAGLLEEALCFPEMPSR